MKYLNKNFFEKFAGMLLLAFLLWAGFPTLTPSARAALDVPQLLNFQGRLTDASRITVDDASYSMKFSLYTASSGGIPVWTASGAVEAPTAISVTVTDGVFSVLLGDTGQNAFNDALFDDNGTLYLGVTIGSDSEMTPRKRVASSAFAMQAGDADLLDSLNSDNDGCIVSCIPATTTVGNLVLTGDPQGTAVSGGVLYINPAEAGAGEILFGVGLTGASRFTVDEDGDAILGSTNSTDISLTLYNSNNSSATVTGSRYATSYDSIQIDEVFNSTYGAAFSYNGLSVAASPNTNMPIYVDESGYTGTTTSNLDETGVFVNLSSNSQGTAVTGEYNYSGTKQRITYNGASANTIVFGGDTRVASAPSSALAEAYGTYSVISHTSSTLTSGYALYGETKNNNAGSTITSAYGVYGYANEGSGTITTGYGGYFRSVNAGTNYALYTAEGRVHIEGDTTATTPTEATGTGELYVFGDIESDANIIAGGQLAVGTTISANDTIGVSDTVTLGVAAGIYNGYKEGITLTGDGNGGGMDATVYGSLVAVNMTDVGGQTDEVKNIVGGRVQTDHTADGTSGRWVGYQSYLDGSVGTVSTAIGLDTLVETSGGTISTAIGLQIDANSGGTDTGIYVARGYVHIDSAVYSSKITPTFTGAAIGDDGTMFVKDSVEIYDGSLCVGDGVTDDCSDAAGTDGIIYSIAASVTGHDVAEMFFSTDNLLAGEIVSADSQKSEYVTRTSGGPIILGAVSTAPGLMLGRGGPNEYPIALNGRTPIKVNGEGGAIAIGDRITISSTPGVGKKAEGAGEVVGVAMEPFDGNGSGAIMSFVLPQWWDGKSSASVTAQTVAPVVETNSVLAIKDNNISNIASLKGYKWSVNDEGVFVTEGSYDVQIKSHQGEDISANAILGRQHLITLAGTAKLEGGSAIVEFENIDPKFNDIISSVRPIMVVATMSNGTGTVSVASKSMNGFTLMSGGEGNGTEADWVVYAYRKDYEPEETPVNIEVVKEEEETTGDVVIGDATAIQEETVTEPSVVPDATPSETAPVETSIETPIISPEPSSAPVITPPTESIPITETPVVENTTTSAETVAVVEPANSETENTP